MADNINSDVSERGVEEFFGEIDAGLAKTVRAMESVESWTRDRQESVQATFQQMADRIEDADFKNDEAAIQTKLIVLLGYISSGKAIKLLMWVEEIVPNFVAKTLAEAQMLAVLDKIDKQAGRLFLERFEVLERLQMLSRIFSEERFEIVQKVLKILAGEHPAGIDD